MEFTGNPSTRPMTFLNASDFGSTEIEGKAKIVKDSQDQVAAIDSTGLCLFTLHAGLTVEHYAKLIDTACGGDWDVTRFLQTGERIWNLERQFNLAAGLTKADDTLPKRILEEPAPSGAAKGLVSKLPEMLPEYYEIRGWTKDGELKPDTANRLGLG